MSERPNPPPNSDPPLLCAGFSLLLLASFSSSAALGSGLKVEPRTNGVADPNGEADSGLTEDPKAEVASGFAPNLEGGGKAVSESIDTSVVLEANAPPGLDPKMLGPLEGAPTDPKPPLAAKLAKPPEAPGEGAAALPKTLPGVAPAAAKPD